MAARTGMADLIQQVRGMAMAGTADTVIAGVSYWSDDQIQQILDRRCSRLVFIPATPIPQVGVGGTSLWYEHRTGTMNLESGTAAFYLQDAAGSTVGTANYTMDYNTGIAIFGTTTAGSVFYFTGKSYDVNGAAADIWTSKAGQAAAGAYSWSTDNMSVNKGNLVKVFSENAAMYRNLSWVQSVDMLRGDEVTSGYTER